MRFAYIDSQGNEVAIPSVDALALRIELGAIGPETELYDAQADRWAPAKSHEIFHTLSRASDEEGFVAPPPPVPSGSDADDGEAAGAEEEGDEPVAGEEMSLGDLAPEADEPATPSGEDAVAEPEPGAASEDEGGMGFDFTLAEEEDALDQPPSGPATGDAGGAEADEMDFAPAAEDTGEMSFDLADTEPTAEAPSQEAADEGEEDGAFDFGGMDTLEVEEPEEPEEEDEGAMDFGGGMEMEEPLADQDDFSTAEDASGGLDLEEPMSEFSSDSPPSWMEQDGPSGGDEDDGAMDFGGDMEMEEDEADEEESAPEPTRGAAGEDAEEEESERKRAAPRSRPSPPRRKPQRSFAGPLIGLVLVAALGAGGWFGWQAFQNREVEPVAPLLPPVTIPDIPAELLPTMRDLGEQALSATVSEMETMAQEADLPAEPRQDWLSGVYLANASQFSDVEEYWLAIETFVGRVRDADTEIFHEKYQEALAAQGLAGDTAAILLERADSGFLATRQERFEAYAQMGDLVNAALDLHDFLLNNEGEIEYDPAAGGMSADPVLEAVPSSRELGDEMWSRVDRITGALDRLGTLDRVTTQRLMAVLFDRIRSAGFR